LENKKFLVLIGLNNKRDYCHRLLEGVQVCFKR
jgi:hypothetical protein